MHSTKVTTPKSKQTENQQNEVGESFRVLYYGSASAGSVPFIWESQPGTPKHALTESSLPPLTPPPSYNQFSQKYNSPMQVSNHDHSSKRSGFFRTIFLDSFRKKNITRQVSFSLSSSSISTFSSSSSHVEDEENGGSPTSTLCFGGEFKKSYRIKKMKNAMVSFIRK